MTNLARQQLGVRRHHGVTPLRVNSAACWSISGPIYGHVPQSRIGDNDHTSLEHVNATKTKAELLVLLRLDHHSVGSQQLLVLQLAVKKLQRRGRI